MSVVELTQRMEDLFGYDLHPPFDRHSIVSPVVHQFEKPYEPPGFQDPETSRFAKSVVVRAWKLKEPVAAWLDEHHPTFILYSVVNTEKRYEAWSEGSSPGLMSERFFIDLGTAEAAVEFSLRWM